MNDIYTDKNTGVLINKLGITDPELLRQAEADITIVKLKEILGSQDFKYGYEPYLNLHQLMFQDIYPFAGELRKIDMQKSERILSGLPMIFGDKSHVSKKLKKVFKEKEINFEASKEEIAAQLVDFMSSIWEIHPFREGNTRSIITYTMKYIRNSGLKIDEDLLHQNFAYIRDALVMSVYQEPKYLEKILLDSIERGMKLWN